MYCISGFQLEKCYFLDQDGRGTLDCISSFQLEKKPEGLKKIIENGRKNHILKPDVVSTPLVIKSFANGVF